MKLSQVAALATSKEGNQDNVAMKMDMGSSELSKRINGQTRWSEKEIDRLCEIAGVQITDCSEYQAEIDKLKDDIATLKKTIRILNE